MYYDELLRLCGYEPEEMERERPRIEKAFEKLEITPEDTAWAEERIRKYSDVRLKSIRKLTGLGLRGLVDIVLAREERDKIVYAARPSLFPVLNAMCMVSKDIYVNTSDSATASVRMFGMDKLSPFLEAAEGDLTPPASAFCPGIQAKLGGLIKGVIPVPDLILSSGHVCDQTPKVDEIIGMRYGVPVVYADCSHGEQEKEWPHPSEGRVRYLAQESKVALAAFEEVTGRTVTEEIARAADSRVAGLAMRRERIFDLVRNADVMPADYHSMSMIMRVSNTGINTTTLYGDLEGILDLFYAELKERIDRGEGVAVQKGAPRVGMYGLIDVEVTSFMEKAGLTLVDLRLSTTKSEREAPSRYQDFWEVSAERVLRYCSRKFSNRLLQLCEESDLDGIVLNYVIGCRDLCITPFKTRDLVTKELGIPALMLEVNMSDTRDYSAESMRSRVEAFTETVKAAKAAKAK